MSRQPRLGSQDRVVSCRRPPFTVHRPPFSGPNPTRLVQAHTYEQVVASTERTRPKLDIEETREGEKAVPPHTYEWVVESTEQTRLKLDQMWPGTREREVTVQAHTYQHVVESTELTLHKLDLVWPGTSWKAKKRNVRHIMVEGSDLHGKGRGREV